jgi:hypothetical protein
MDSADFGKSSVASATARDTGQASAPRCSDTHEVSDIDADDLRDLLGRLEARIGAR